MKVIVLIAAVLALSATTASAQYLSGTGSNPNNHYVAPHTTSNGAYVSGPLPDEPEQHSTRQLRHSGQRQSIHRRGWYARRQILNAPIRRSPAKKVLM
jgi:hypothetical protein